MIECPSVGELQKMSIKSDGRGIGPSWLLDKIIIEDLSAHRTYEFLFNTWLR